MTPVPVAFSVSACNPMTAVQPCPDDESGATRTTWPFFSRANDTIYEAPGDPSPGSPGLWLGAAVAPGVCFNDHTPNISDADRDWLDDGCELELARAFSPRWSMGEQDECPDGEPVWAAKYFPNAGAVRLAFMPAYYDDCGPGDTMLNVGAGHAGDSEFVMVEVGFNHATRHWEFRSMWLSAHYGAGGGDRSQWVPASETGFTRRYLGHPYVAVSANKHANYKNESKCNNTTAAGAGWGDYCYGSINSPFRFPIDPARNVGSRFNALVGCIGSTKRFVGNGRTECFYLQDKKFAGWHTGVSGVTSYYSVLVSDKFEVRYGDAGPGPTPYGESGPDPWDPPPIGGGCPDPTQVQC